MNVLSSVMQGVSALLQVYTILLVIRIVLTWVSMDHGHPMLRILHSITDPYLNWFRRFRFLVVGQLDLSPVAALLVVNFVSILLNGIAMEGQITLGIMLAILVRLVWGAVSFLLWLIGILALIRFAAIRFRWGGTALWSYVDALLQPPAYAFGRLLRPGSFLAYTTTLVALGAAALGAGFVGNILIGLAVEVLRVLPV